MNRPELVELDAAAERDATEPNDVATQPEGMRIYATVLADGNIHLDYDDGISVSELFVASALLARQANLMLDGAQLVAAQQAAQEQKDAAARRRLIVADRLPKRRN